jgi:hypothetical protein
MEKRLPMNISTSTRKGLLGGLLLTALGNTLVVEAGVSGQAAEQLKTTLTPFGAERAGNEEGTIPAWTGGMLQPPAGYLPGQHRPDPFPQDTVRFTITADNMAQYAQYLSEGQKALLKKYPDSFRLPVYPTRRSFSAPDWVYENAHKNALSARLAENGNGVENAFGAVPFPIPQNGLQAIWNHNLRWMGEATYKEWQNFTVYNNGRISYDSGNMWEDYPYYEKDQSATTFNGNLLQLFVEYTAPARRIGEINLVIDPLNQVNTPRQSWKYTPGQRRVRRAPTISYDTPNPAANGFATYDDVFGYNGAPDRYDWALVGKQEMFIPYNSYRFLNAMDRGKQRTELFPALHPDPAEERWEPWTIALADSYDARGTLWRTIYSHLINAYEVQAIVPRGVTSHDLLADAYVVTEYDQTAIRLYEGQSDQFYTPQRVRKLARR